MRLMLGELARPERSDSPLILSLSKDEQLAEDSSVEGRARCSWFDKLTTSVNVQACRTHPSGDPV